MILEAKNIDFSYSKKKVLKGVSFSLNSGELVCLSGPNGSGKSTLLKILSGIEKNNSVSISSPYKKTKYLSSMKVLERAENISYMCQNEVCAWEFTVWDFVKLGRFCHEKNVDRKKNELAVAKALEKLQISNLASKKITEISGGEFQKARIARNIAQDTPFMFLDEPVANLDFSYQEEVLELLKNIAHEENKGILISIHDINTAIRYADRMALLSRQKPLVVGKIQDVIKPGILSATYGTIFSVYNHPIHKCLQIAKASLNQ